MKHEDIQKFKARLEKEKAEIVSILEKVGERVDHSDKFTARVPNFGDDLTEYEDEEADEAEEFGTRIGINQVLSEKLQSIDAALERMNKKTYGVCTACGNEIGHDVLDANPASELCKACKKPSV
ncbi:MAG: hypothetical protein A2939_03020 [Parcubacteria group bacterium RIFCSPLOWO2_01_FULL_48_18]|nr:MAG: hypothetical protein A2939_03020 [Parcubacteria group bacterium RIFCSPLOWO2_01_FULL_48_18]